MALLAVVVVPRATPGDEPVSIQTENGQRASNQWHLKYPIDAPQRDTRVGEFHMWIDDGWFVGERRNRDGDIEWKIVFAKAVGDEKPVLSHGLEADTFRISYRDKYFIRDEQGNLRCLRQLKTEDDAWPVIEQPAGEDKLFTPRLQARISDSWVTMVARPVPMPPARFKVKEFRWDCLLRLARQDLGGPDLKVNAQSAAIRVSYGDWFVVDDGEFLVADKLESWQVPWELNRKLRSLPAPGVPGQVWLNTDEPPTWESLGGKAVLFLLFDLGQPTLVPLVSPLLGLLETYSKQGLRVIGVHAKGPRDVIQKRLADEHITFPVLIDDGEGPNRFGVPFSASVLLDWTGTVVRVYENALVAPAEIEKLLVGPPRKTRSDK